MRTTKTVDETGTEAGEVKSDEETVDAAETETADGETTEEAAETTEDLVGDDEELFDSEELYDGEELTDGEEKPKDEEAAGIRQGAGAIVSAALGVVSLTGGWIGSVASARESLVGQLHTSSSASVAKQVKEVYGDAWKASALWGGLFALLALGVGVAVLARPAFGVPGKPQQAWIKSVAWAGVALGVIGLLLAVLKYTDLLLGLPSTS